MKRTSRKTLTLSLVPRATQQEDLSHGESENSKDYFDGWVRSVSPELLRTKESETILARLFHGNLPLTAADVVRVLRCTVRESSDHRYWPPDVVRKFMVADVITGKKNR